MLSMTPVTAGRVILLWLRMWRIVHARFNMLIAMRSYLGQYSQQ